MECSPDYGADAYGDQQGQGVPSLRGKEVNSLKTVSLTLLSLLSIFRI